MYESFFGFSEKPFNIVPNPKFLYHSKKHDNALTYLEYALTEGTGFTLLTGGIGTGKTTLIRHILNQVDDKKNIAVVFNTNVDAEQLFNLIMQEFDLEPIAGNKAKNLELLNHFLIECYAKKIDPILIIDEAQNLSNEVLEDVRLLTNLQNDEQNLLQIILVGQPELKTKMEDPALVQLNQRVSVRYHLTELSREEVAAYIASRLTIVGGKPDIFDDGAVSLIYDASGGVPRLINTLCDSALVYAFADEVKSIGQEIVQQVIDDRGGMKRLSDIPAVEAISSIETGEGGNFPTVDFTHNLATIENKLVNLAKHFKRFQTDQEKQHGQLDEDLAEIHLLLEKEKRKINKLELDLTRLKISPAGRDSATDESIAGVREHQQEGTWTSPKEAPSIFSRIGRILSGK